MPVCPIHRLVSFSVCLGYSRVRDGVRFSLAPALGARIGMAYDMVLSSPHSIWTDVDDGLSYHVTVSNNEAALPLRRRGSC